MRAFLAGLLSLLISGLAWANPGGEVESIGFNGAYRPDCWTPMLIRIKPGTLKTDFYQIQVRQTDLDGDQVTFYKTISVTGGEEGGTNDQRYWMYFIPRPRELPSNSLRELQKEIKVTLATKNGKELLALPITSAIQSIDETSQVPFDTRRGARLVLCVSDGNSAPILDEVGDARALLGVMEDTQFVRITPSALPENPKAYQAVDAIVWTNVDPSTLKTGDGGKYRAVEAWIRDGGHFVISTPADWQKMNDFADLLPVAMTGVDSAASLAPLKFLARDPKTLPASGQLDPRDPWEQVKGPYRMVRAAPLPGAVVEETIDWSDDGKQTTPWLVRKTYGAGCVTWIAQDLGDKTITTWVKSGWLHVWNRVLGTRDQPLIVRPNTSEAAKRPFLPGAAVDTGHSLLAGTELSGTSSLLVSIAVLFFIIYWLIAGPGSFVYLSSKKRTQASWFIFGLCAIAATAMTVVIVKLVLRGPPKMKHVSFVRAVQGEPAHIISRIGLYIPRDGDQTIELKNTSGALAELTALPRHAAHSNEEIESTVAVEYRVGVREMASEGAPAITIPYRSTLKKLQAHWTGELAGRIEGQASLSDPREFLAGKLTNGTGQELRNIYFAFHYPGSGGNAGDHIVYLPKWEKGLTLDLSKLVVRNVNGDIVPFLAPDKGLSPAAGKHVRGTLNVLGNWCDFWYPPLRRAGGMTGDGKFNDLETAVPQSFPVLSVFGRLPPMQNPADAANRVEVLRRGARFLDVSNALIGGSLVVLAQSQGQLPVPAEVEGDTMTGDGLIFYQFILPLDRTAAEKAAEEEENP